MEHAQREDMLVNQQNVLLLVLILILMEHAQRAYQKTVHGVLRAVLILILMEHAQRDN